MSYFEIRLISISTQDVTYAILLMAEMVSQIRCVRNTTNIINPRLTNNFLFEDRCALPDQMTFVLTFPWRAFVFAMRNRDCTNQDEISISALGVTTKDFPHDMLLPRLTGSILPRRCFPPHQKRKPTRRVCAFFQSESLVGFESKYSFDISAAVYRMPPITLMVAARACSGRNLCQATTASRSVGQSVEIAPL
jgi:hypothetical protein